ncbi:MAG: hypothetical protein D6731_22290 [Planctomycetota bacterium]|nr:MAG: hypothetical protein D6731_22290 [Planctomycetota bacterium]
MERPPHPRAKAGAGTALRTARPRPRRWALALAGATLAGGAAVVDPAGPGGLSDAGLRLATGAGRALAAVLPARATQPLPTGPRALGPGARSLAGLQALLAPSGGRVLRFDVGSAQGPPWPLLHGDPAAPAAAAFRREQGLDAIASQGGLVALLALNRWVHDRWEYGLPSRTLHTARAPDILAAAAAGERFFCAHSAYVLAQAGWSLGYGARVLRLEAPDGRVHAAAELWCPSLGRWVYLDPTFARHFVLPGAPERPLAALELQEARRARRAVLEVRAGEAPRPAAAADLDLFWRLRVCRRDDFLLRSYPRWHPLYFGNLWQGLWPDLDPDSDWTVGEVACTVRALGPRRLELDLATYTPGFQRFEARQDGGPWHPAPARLAWRLRRGTNRLALRAVGSFGRAGRPARLEVEVP